MRKIKLEESIKLRTPDGLVLLTPEEKEKIRTCLMIGFDREGRDIFMRGYRGDPPLPYFITFDDIEEPEQKSEQKPKEKSPWNAHWCQDD